MRRDPLNGGSMIKQLVKRGRGVYLRSFNEAYEEHHVQPEDELRVPGIITQKYTLRDLHEKDGLTCTTGVVQNSGRFILVPAPGSRPRDPE